MHISQGTARKIKFHLLLLHAQPTVLNERCSDSAAGVAVAKYAVVLCYTIP